MSSYLIVIEGAEDENFSSYSPDLPGVVAAADTRDECEALMQEAMVFHLEAMTEAGESVPPPTSTGAYVEVG